MNPHEIDALACEVLDGTATDTQRRELETWLAGHPEDRERFERLRETFATLARIPSAEAPSGLREAVIGAIRAGETARRVAAAAVPSPAPAPAPRRAIVLPARPRFLQFAVPFGAGLAAGILILAGWMGGISPRPGHDVAGSMVPPGETRDWRFALGAAQIEPRIWTRPGSSSMRLRVRNSRQLAVEVVYDARLRRVAKVHADLASGPWQLHPGRLHWQPATGDEITIEFADPAEGSPLQLVLESPDGRREETLVPARGGAPR